jgi:hypothetical protein
MVKLIPSWNTVKQIIHNRCTKFTGENYGSIKLQLDSLTLKDVLEI